MSIVTDLIYAAVLVGSLVILWRAMVINRRADEINRRSELIVDESQELVRLFELQQTRMTEATLAWRLAHPGNDDVLPDLGDVLTWLLKERKEMLGS